MSESPSKQEQQLSPEQIMLQESFASFNQASIELSKHIPEITGRPEIAEAGKELIEEFGLKPSLFDSQDRAVVFAGIASRWASTKETGKESEKAFVADTIALLAYEHSDKLTDAALIIESDNKEFGGEAKVKAYNRYTDKHLTEVVKQSIEKGFLDSVKKRLKIDESNEEPYDIRVLSIANEHQTFEFGYSDQDVNEWRDGLGARAQKLAKELGYDDLFAPAWVTDIDGVRTICISSAMAEKIENPAAFTDKDALTRDYAYLEHEYTHTQGSVMVDKEIFFGINMEELRAEHFSGNKHGYQDIKGFFGGYHVITGHDIELEFDKVPKGGTVTEMWGAIANKVGLSVMLEIMMASPRNYVQNQANTFQKEAFNHIGGYDGILERLYNVSLASGDGPSISDRLDKAAQRLVEIDATNPEFDFLESFEAYRAGHSLRFMTRKYVNRARELQLAGVKD